MLRRYGPKEGLLSLITPAAFYSTLAFALLYAMWPYFYYVKNETLITIGVFAAWRYSWQILNFLRSVVYSRLYYPRLKRVVAALPPERRFPDTIYFVIPSYREAPWVSVECIQALMSNIAAIPSKACVVISTAGEEDDRVILAAYNAHPARFKTELVIQHQQHGKRIAMGHALRAVARRYDLSADSVTVFMDGDSYMEPDLLQGTVPFFAAFRDLGALTTNEVAYINTRSRLYQHWFNLKFGQRHMLFQSHALSRKVLTLTGRFSMFRTGIVTAEDFISMMENDTLTHWNQGKFRFLMGDDKSSWFYLLRQRWSMLYIPDVLCYSLESRDADFFAVSISLPFRWYGNTLRNNARALALGPRTTGLFIWVAILDQRLSMWTALVGITGALLLAVFKSFIYFPFYLGWVLIVRVVQLSWIAARGHPVSMYTIPLMLYNQWIGALVKIRANFRLADQRWSKGGQSTQSGDTIPVAHPLAPKMPVYLMLLSYGMFLFALLLAQGILALPGLAFFEARLARLAGGGMPMHVVTDDGLDDSGSINASLRAAAQGAVLRLPCGAVDLYQPVLLRSHVTLAGCQGGHTTLVSHLSSPAAGALMLHGAMTRTPARLSRDTVPGERRLSLTTTIGIRPGALLLLKMPNDERLLAELGSERWDRRYPYLRQTIVRVTAVTAQAVELEHPVGLALSAGRTRIELLRPLQDVTLADFTLTQVIPGAHGESARFRYENLHPEAEVDLVSLQYAADVTLRGLQLIDAGRHPVALDQVYHADLDRLDIDGAWNKGAGGNGYVKLARTYHSRFHDSRVTHLRHITLQWSSAFNLIEGIDSGVDINLHGGYTHDNVIRKTSFRIPPQHPWKGVVHTPPTAHWAPPDGDNRIDAGSIVYAAD